MISMMDQLTTDVTENVISQITSKLLPAIAERYDIPLDELLELVNNKSTKKTTIKARPKRTSVQETTPKSKATRDIQLKIKNAQEQDKVLNVCTGRPLADSTTNRKKYQFFDELGIAGIAGDTKLTEALKLLGASSKKEVPVHRQAARARARATQQESDSESETEILVPQNADDYLEDNSDIDSDNEEPKSSAKKTPVKKSEPKKTPVKKSEPKKTPVKKSEPAKKTPVKKSEPAKKTSVKKSEPKSSAKKPVKPVKRVIKKASEDGSEDIDTVVKLSNIIEEGNAEVDEMESDNDELVTTVKGKQPQARYNSKIKQWWNPQTSFVFKRKGIKSFVVGKVEGGNHIVPLSAADLKECKKLGWATDTTILNKKTAEESNEGETSSESENDE